MAGVANKKSLASRTDKFDIEYKSSEKPCRSSIRDEIHLVRKYDLSAQIAFKNTGHKMCLETYIKVKYYIDLYLKLRSYFLHRGEL